MGIYRVLEEESASLESRAPKSYLEVKRETRTVMAIGKRISRGMRTKGRRYKSRDRLLDMLNELRQIARATERADREARKVKSDDAR